MLQPRRLKNLQLQQKQTQQRLKQNTRQPMEEDKGDEEDEEENDEDEMLTPWEAAVRNWLENLTPWFGFFVPGPQPIFVGIGDDVQPDTLAPTPLQCPDPETGGVPGEPPTLPVRDGQTWLEGCIEFLWVQGTRPKADPRRTSNPITRTIQWVMRNVNEIWGKCGCVRFKAYLTVVTLNQLGDIANAESGISVVEGRTRSAGRNKINPKYGQKIKQLQQHKECTGFLVVDGVDGGAGFGSGGVGVVTVNRVSRQQDWGDTTAHELGHALAGIPHVVDKGKPTERKHKHGELMWGKGCDGHPRRENRRYDKVTSRDCDEMKKVLRDTGEPCEEPDDQ
jgi:hypothetical protein